MEGEGEVSRHKAVMELSGGSPPGGEIRAGSARKTVSYNPILKE